MNGAGDQELQSVFSIILERRWLAIGVAFLAVAGGIAYTVFAPPIWEAKATIVFPVRSPGVLGTGNFDQGSLATSLAGGPTPLKVFAGMLESERALDFISDKSGVGRRKVRDMRFIQEQPTESSITISARDTDAKRAQSIVALHLDALREVNEKVSKPLDSNDAELLKAKLTVQQKVVADCEKALLEFQQKAQTSPTVVAAASGKDLNLIPASGHWSELLSQLEIQHASLDTSIRDAQSRTKHIAATQGNLPSSLPPVEKWRGKLTDLEYELKVKELTLAKEAPEVVKLRQTINLTEQQLRSELAQYSTAKSAGMVDSSSLTQRVALEAQISAVSRLAKLAPAEAIKLSQLTRDVTTQSSILQQLQSQYELASLQADRDPNHWQVLDEPRVDDKAINKSFAKNGIMSLIGGCALGAFFAIFAPRRKQKAEKIVTEIYESKAA